MCFNMVASFAELGLSATKTSTTKDNVTNPQSRIGGLPIESAWVNSKNLKTKRVLHEIFGALHLLTRIRSRTKSATERRLHGSVCRCLSGICVVSWPSTKYGSIGIHERPRDSRNSRLQYSPKKGRIILSAKKVFASAFRDTHDVITSTTWRGQTNIRDQLCWIIGPIPQNSAESPKK